MIRGRFLRIFWVRLHSLCKIPRQLRKISNCEISLDLISKFHPAECVQVPCGGAADILFYYIQVCSDHVTDGFLSPLRGLSIYHQFALLGAFPGSLLSLVPRLGRRLVRKRSGVLVDQLFTLRLAYLDGEPKPMILRLTCGYRSHFDVLLISVAMCVTSVAPEIPNFFLVWFDTITGGGARAEPALVRERSTRRKPPVKWLAKAVEKMLHGRSVATFRSNRTKN